MKISRKHKSFTILDKNSTYIEKGVKIGNGVIIYPNNHIFGNSIIEDGVTLLPNNCIFNSVIGKGSKVAYSYIEESKICENVSIGPFARIRPNSHIGNNCKIGNFVEVKNAVLKDGTKASHLAYVGDAAVGRNCNIGCGAIFVNYNGKTMNKIKVQDNSFIGSNVNLIAPLDIAKGTYISSGTTVTQSTNEYDFIIGKEEY